MLHLVTGGSGFVGSKIAKRLYSMGERVRILDIIDSPERPKEIEFIKCDILDRQKVFETVQGADYVYHNIALVPLTKAGPKFWEVNVQGTKNILDAAKKVKVKMFFHMSSSAVFAGLLDRCPISDDISPKPIETYGKTKLAAERYVLETGKEGLPITILRPRSLLGPGRLGIFQILFEWVRDGKKIYIMGKGDNLIQFLHINDLVDAIMLCLKKRKTGTFNLGTDRYSSLADDLQALINYAKTSSQIVSLPINLTRFILKSLNFFSLSPLMPLHYNTYHKSFYFDISKAKRELGWQPKYSNKEMLIEGYRWFLENQHLLKEKNFSIHRSPAKQKILKIVKWFS